MLRCIDLGSPCSAPSDMTTTRALSEHRWLILRAITPLLRSPGGRGGAAAQRRPRRAAVGAAAQRRQPESAGADARAPGGPPLARSGTPSTLYTSSGILHTAYTGRGVRRASPPAGGRQAAHPGVVGLLLEDDAALRADFVPALRQTLAALPAEWEVLLSPGR